MHTTQNHQYYLFNTKHKYYLYSTLNHSVISKYHSVASSLVVVKSGDESSYFPCISISDHSHSSLLILPQLPLLVGSDSGLPLFVGAINWIFYAKL